MEALCSDADCGECVLLLAEVVLMRPGTDTARSGRGPIATPTTAHYFYMMIWNRLID